MTVLCVVMADGPAPSGPTPAPAASTSIPRHAMPQPIAVPVPMVIPATAPRASPPPPTGPLTVVSPIEHFLASINLSVYNAAMREYGVDTVEMLLVQSKEDLVGAGVKTGHAMFMIKKAQELAATPATSASPGQAE